MTRHDPDPVSLVAGLVFTGLGLSFLVGGDAILDVDWQWIWPPLLVGAGVVGLRWGSHPNGAGAPPERPSGSFRAIRMRVSS